MADKMWWYMQQIKDHDVSSLSPDKRAIFDDMMSAEMDHYQTSVKKMIAKIRGDAAHVSEIKAEYGMRSGYLHGDQSAIYEMLIDYRDDVKPRASFIPRFSEHRILGSNAQLVLLFMDAIGEATGRTYAANVLAPKLFKAFEIKQNM
jgi:hypothetical protein